MVLLWQENTTKIRWVLLGDVTCYSTCKTLHTNGSKQKTPSSLIWSNQTIFDQEKKSRSELPRLNLTCSLLNVPSSVVQARKSFNLSLLPTPVSQDVWSYAKLKMCRCRWSLQPAWAMSGLPPMGTLILPVCFLNPVTQHYKLKNSTGSSLSIYVYINKCICYNGMYIYK